MRRERERKDTQPYMHPYKIYMKRDGDIEYISVAEDDVEPKKEDI